MKWCVYVVTLFSVLLCLTIVTEMLLEKQLNEAQFTFDDIVFQWDGSATKIAALMDLDVSMVDVNGDSSKGSELPIVGMIRKDMTQAAVEALEYVMLAPTFDPNGLHPRTPLKVAALRDRPDVVALLLRHPKVITEVFAEGLSCEHVAHLPTTVTLVLNNRDVLPCFRSRNNVASTESKLLQNFNIRREERSNPFRVLGIRERPRLASLTARDGVVVNPRAFGSVRGALLFLCLGPSWISMGGLLIASACVVYNGILVYCLRCFDTPPQPEVIPQPDATPQDPQPRAEPNADAPPP